MVSHSLRMLLEGALVKATNLALEEKQGNESLDGQSVVLVLSHTFPLISDALRRDLNYDVSLVRCRMIAVC